MGKGVASTIGNTPFRAVSQAGLVGTTDIKVVKDRSGFPLMGMNWNGNSDCRVVLKSLESLWQSFREN